MLDMDRGIAIEQKQFVRHHAGDNGGLRQWGFVDLVLNAVIGVFGNASSLLHQRLFSCGYRNRFPRFYL
jgi:hypothetical protein